MGGEKNFSVAREKQNPEKKYCRPIFFWKISGGARQKGTKRGQNGSGTKNCGTGFFVF